MKRFNVTVRTEYGSFAYSAIAARSSDLIGAAIDLFGPCYVKVSCA